MYGENIKNSNNAEAKEMVEKIFNTIKDWPSVEVLSFLSELRSGIVNYKGARSDEAAKNYEFHRSELNQLDPPANSDKPYK